MGSKNKLLLLFCSLTLMLYIISCSDGSYSTLKSIENDTNNSIKMSYSKFNGYKFKSLQLKSGNILDLNTNVNTNSGTLSLFLLTEDGLKFIKLLTPKHLCQKK